MIKDKVFNELKEKAISGNAEAQYGLGCHLYLDKKYDDATLWLNKSADQGHGDAMMALGHLYYHRESLPGHAELSVYWYKQAAKIGVPNAASEVAYAYADGKGVHQDDRKCFEWDVIEAARGDVKTMRFISECYQNNPLGVSVDQDLSDAWAWLAADVEAEMEKK